MASTFNTSGIRDALKRLDSLRRETKRELTERAARGFLRTVVDITPPASKKATGGDAKKAGEAAIRSDARRIFEVISDKDRLAFIEFHGGTSTKEKFAHQGAAALGDIEKRVLNGVSQLLAWHAQRRNNIGRVQGVKGGNRIGNLAAAAHITTGLRKKDLRGLDVGYVSKADLDALLKKLYADVGKLGAGWNAACEALKVKVPAWIKRHGKKHGTFRLTIGETYFAIEVANEVPFVENVKAYNWRIQRALDIQARKMNREADFLLKKAIKKAGFK